jgi:hypothetical protein
VKALTAKQHELGIFGSVGEIGVHHGKFLIPIIGNALAGEPAVAMDLFEDQSSNVDVSGETQKCLQLITPSYQPGLLLLCKGRKGLRGGGGAPPPSCAFWHSQRQ